MTRPLKWDIYRTISAATTGGPERRLGEKKRISVCFGRPIRMGEARKMNFREAYQGDLSLVSDGISKDSQETKTFLEFFAGGGMARAGLGDGWTCSFANDIDAMKGRTYAANWGDDHLALKDVATVKTKEIGGKPDLAWASFPCQDLSLAGTYNGLEGERSGMFWAFWRVMKGLHKEGRAPRIIVLENVYGALTSNESRDFSAIGDAIVKLGYRFGSLVIDARHFVPQSRPRLFWVAVRADVSVPAELISATPVAAWSPDALIEAHSKLSKRAAKNWIWWSLPLPSKKSLRFVDIIEDEPTGVSWHTEAETKNLLSMMDEVNRAKVTKAQATKKKMVGGVYRRTRLDKSGNKVQRAEVRFDDLAGCLRTPSGGSSRQTILVVEGKEVRSRLLSPREAARLMGLPDSYKLPARYNDAYHVAGDGVVAPVVRHLAECLFEPLLA